MNSRGLSLFHVFGESVASLVTGARQDRSSRVFLCGTACVEPQDSYYYDRLP